LAFPDDTDAPAQFSQCSCPQFVAFDVLAKLLFPEWDSTLGPIRESAATMPMPEATVYKYDEVLLRNDDVRLPRKVGRIGPKTTSESAQRSPNQLFRLRVFRPDASHVPAAPFLGNDIHPVPTITSRQQIKSKTIAASLRASNGGTAFPTCWY
jgi:hypothetical protein